MLLNKTQLRIATFALGATCVASLAFAQNGADANAAPQASKRVQALSAPSIRPYIRQEIPANQTPNLYDKRSEEFKAFREDLGKTETSTKTKKRIAEINARNVYADPMDKPAADGSKFVNIFDENEIYSDGEPFVDPDDPDVAYEPLENNVLSQADLYCALIQMATSQYFGVGAGTPGSNQSGYPGMQDGMIGGGIVDDHMMPPGPPMGNESLDPSGGGVSMGGSGASSSSAPNAQQAPKVEKSRKDDTRTLFPDGVPEYKAPEVEASEDADFDLFAADREFKPKAPATNANASGYGGVSGGVSGGMPASSDYHDMGK